ncbi:AIPR family protein [Qipengyuania spongiae]|uniref:AIPR family protein n=1 Tax=Qipengyuania spongiae TaxID=2909673 RepID=A0ABY5T2V2_9SPHN|nr:AIPR family protein [Qipengyuania spongiae]UVI39676.1 AIPR family protein [Qipengyuania spongiae]
METSVAEFFHDFRQETLAGAEASSSFQLAAFMEAVATELVETGFVEGFEFCHYRALRGMRVDGYWFNDEGALDLFVADFDSRSELSTLTRTDVDAAFKRLASFFEASAAKGLSTDLEVTSPEYGLSRQIADRKGSIRQLNLILVSERAISDRIQSLPDGEIQGIPTRYNIWDISRLHRQRSSRSHKEPLDLDFTEMFGAGIPCLPAHLGSGTYQSYLMVMPAEVISGLYAKFGARLLEQNVRTFLQARGKVNKGIRTTILTEPGMFFAYNNGITATAQSVEVADTGSGLEITRILDLQIVNGGQTTASLFHTRRKDKADLANIFVQMKLSVIDSDQSEIIVPRISEYANTQNRVNAADFFSNHPFHVRMEEFSRRLWAPAQQGAQRETKWFYERARGQYADAQSKLTPGEQKRFKAENPKPQMFTKTDLAKFENTWDEHPRWVNLGAQKNFAKYAYRIGKEWDKSPDTFNEFYFRRAVARGIVFRALEKLVSSQPWYNGGYRANIVAYTIAVLSEIAKRHKQRLDFQRIWNDQGINRTLEQVLSIIAKAVNDDITKPAQGISNISEWCKKDACWTRIQTQIARIEPDLPVEFWDELVSADEAATEAKSAKKTQKIDNGIDAQRRVLEIPASHWANIQHALSAKRLLSPKEVGILRIAAQIPSKIPTEKQCAVLLETIEKAREEGISVP